MAEPIYRLTKTQLNGALDGAIGMYLEYRDIHERDEASARIAGVEEIVAGLDADRELAANDPTERLKLQLPDAHEDLFRAINGFRWLGNNLDNIKASPDQFRSFFEAALQDAQHAIAKAKGGDGDRQG